MADDLLRVVAVDGTLIPDLRRRFPGRGAWLHPVPECLSRAERRSAFPRALRVPGPLDVDRVRSFLQQHVCENGASETGTAEIEHHPGSGTLPDRSEDESQVDPS